MIKRFIYPQLLILYRVGKWLRWRFTVPGRWALAAVVAAAVLGVDTRRSMAFQMFSVLAALLGIAFLMTLRFRGRFEIRRMLPDFVTAGEPFQYRLLIRNTGRRAEAGLAIREIIRAHPPTRDEFLNTPEPGERRRNLFDRVFGYYRWRYLLTHRELALPATTACPTVLPDRTETVRMTLTPRHRGVLRLNGVRVMKPDPLGIMNAAISVPLPRNLTVLPKRYPVAAPAMPGERKYHSGGVALTSSVGDSEEFVSLRDYRPGDPLRKIHWKGWARTGKPVVKEYQGEYFVRHALILDTFQSAAHSPAFEAAVSVAASFACTLQTQESLLDLMFVGDQAYCFTAGRSLGHAGRLLEVLAAVMPCTDRPFTTLTDAVAARAPLISGCICIFLSWEEDRRECVHRLRMAGVPLRILVIAEPEAAETIDPGPLGGDAGEFRVLRSDRIREGLAGL